MSTKAQTLLAVLVWSLAFCEAVFVCNMAQHEVHAAVTPTLVQAKMTASDGQSYSGVGALEPNSMSLALREPAQASNFIFTAVSSEDQPATDVTQSDNESQTYTKQISIVNSSAPRGLYLFTTQNIAAGTQYIYTELNTGGGLDQIQAAEFYNMPTTTTARHTCSDNWTSATATPNCGSMAATAGDLVIICAQPYVWATTPAFGATVTPGSGFTLLNSDTGTGFTCEYEIATGTVNETDFTLPESATDGFIAGMDLEPASSTTGSGAPAGVYMNNQIFVNVPTYYSGGTGTSLVFQLPCPANTTGIYANFQGYDESISSATDGTNTFAIANGTWTESSGTAGASLIYSLGSNFVSCGGTETITVTFGAALGNTGETIQAATLQGTGALDTAAACSNGGTTLVSGVCIATGTAAFTSGDVTALTITPGTAHDFLISFQQENEQTVTSMVSPSDSSANFLMDFMCTSTIKTACPVADIPYANFGFEQDQGFGTDKPSTASAVTFEWGYTESNTSGGNIGGWVNLTIAIEPASTGNACKPELTALGAGCA